LSETAAITRRISLASDVDLLPLLGRNDDHLKTLESELDIRIVARGHDIMLKGDERQVKKAERALVQLAELVRAGTPPHGGIALGLDRIVAILAGESSIREVIAFPKTANAVDLMAGAPSVVDAKQLRELHLKTQN